MRGGCKWRGTYLSIVRFSRQVSLDSEQERPLHDQRRKGYAQTLRIRAVNSSAELMLHNYKMKERTHSGLLSSSLCCRNWWWVVVVKDQLTQQVFDPLATSVDRVDVIFKCASHLSSATGSRVVVIDISHLQDRLGDKYMVCVD